MKKLLKISVVASLGASLVLPAVSMSSANAADIVTTAKAFVANSLAAKAGFTPPSQGATAQKKDSAVIACVASDLSNEFIAITEVIEKDIIGLIEELSNRKMVVVHF